MSLPIQLTLHQGFDYWTVIDANRVVKNQASYYWVRCRCGETRLVRVTDLIGHKSQSCGCLQREIARKRLIIHNDSVHRSRNPLYYIWRALKDRCLNSHNKDYEYYGGRGITLCDEWKNRYVCFRNWAMSHGYQPGLVIDRENNDLGYFPENCRFVTVIESHNNMSSNHILTAFHESKSIAEWVRDPRCRVKYSTLKQRINCKHWDHEKAITTPPVGYPRIRSQDRSLHGLLPMTLK